MTKITEAEPEIRSFEADVAKLLHLVVHSVYSEEDVFLRELISNAADACETLRYEGLSNASLLGEDGQPRITVTLNPDNCSQGPPPLSGRSAASGAHIASCRS